MPNNNGSSGATTALLAILVIAVVAFGIWYVMKSGQQAPEEDGAGLQITVGDTDDEGTNNP